MLAALLALALTADAPKIAKPLSLHAVTATGVLFDFETDRPSELAPDVFRVGVSGGGGWSGGEPRAHKRLEKTLEPNAQYVWRMPVGERELRGSFYAAPRPGSLTPFTFAVVGDARDHARWAELSRAILDKHPRFILDTGDNIQGGDSRDAWRDFYVAGAALFANTPYFATIGNHDEGSLYAEYNPAPSTGIGPSTYAFQYGNAGFIAVDSNEPEDAKQLAFVSRALKAMSGGPLFVFHHHPLYSCGGHGSSERMQRAFQPLFEQAHVTYDFGGHDHDLIDWKPIRGVHYAVSGGGGTVTYPLGRCGDAAFAKQSFGFVLVSVDGAKVRATFYDEHGIGLYRAPVIAAAGPSIPRVDLDALAHPPAK